MTFIPQTSNVVFPTKLKKRIDKLSKELNLLYPEKIIIFLKRDYPALSHKVRDIRKKTNFKDNEAFFASLGFQYVDYNKLSEDYYQNKDEILKVMQRINDGRDKTTKTTNINVDEYKDLLNPIESYYYDNNWHPLGSNKNITNTIQKKINFICEKLLQLYPERIVVNLYSNHKHFVEDHLKPLKAFFNCDNYSSLLNLFGFINPNFKIKYQQDNSILSEELSLQTVNWVPRNDLYYDSSYQEIINYVFDITYAVFPNKVITNLNALYSFTKYKNYFNTLLKVFKIKKDFLLFNEFGFILSNDLNEQIEYPEFLYSPNKEILYKIFSDKKKIPLDENTKIIEEDALSELAIETLDLSLINERSLIFKKNCINNCYNLKNIYNISAIKECNEYSIVNCNKLDSKTLIDNFNSVYSKDRLFYIIDLLNENCKIISFVSDKLYRVGSYVKNEKDNKVYLVNNISYGKENDFLNYPILKNYKQLNSKNYPEKYIINYNPDLQTKQFVTFPTNYISFVKSYFNYFNDETDFYFYSGESQDKKITFDNLLLPIYENNKLIKHEKIDIKSILNNNNAKKIDCSIVDKTLNLVDAIIGINNFHPFMQYIHFIYNPTYIKTFLKINETNPYIFLNSSFLCNDPHFLKSIFELYPDLDSRIVPERLKNILLSDNKGSEVIC